MQGARGPVWWVGWGAGPSKQGVGGRADSWIKSGSSEAEGLGVYGLTGPHSVCIGDWAGHQQSLVHGEDYSYWSEANDKGPKEGVTLPLSPPLLSLGNC